jgi:predicted RNase H-like HicB family nuclease
MLFRATLQRTGECWLATCLDLEASGEGKTREEAIESLRIAIEERETPEAMAPPEVDQTSVVEILIVGQHTDERAQEPTGPGDASGELETRPSRRARKREGRG